MPAYKNVANFSPAPSEIIKHFVFILSGEAVSLTDVYLNKWTPRRRGGALPNNVSFCLAGDSRLDSTRFDERSEASVKSRQVDVTSTKKGD